MKIIFFWANKTLQIWNKKNVPIYFQIQMIISHVFAMMSWFSFESSRIMIWMIHFFVLTYILSLQHISLSIHFKIVVKTIFFNIQNVNFNSVNCLLQLLKKQGATVSIVFTTEHRFYYHKWHRKINALIIMISKPLVLLLVVWIWKKTCSQALYKIFLYLTSYLSSNNPS